MGYKRKKYIKEKLKSSALKYKYFGLHNKYFLLNHNVFNYSLWDFPKQMSNRNAEDSLNL